MGTDRADTDLPVDHVHAAEAGDTEPGRWCHPTVTQPHWGILHILTLRSELNQSQVRLQDLCFPQVPPRLGAAAHPAPRLPPHPTALRVLTCKSRPR